MVGPPWEPFPGLSPEEDVATTVDTKTKICGQSRVEGIMAGEYLNSADDRCDWSR